MTTGRIAAKFWIEYIWKLECWYLIATRKVIFDVILLPKLYIKSIYFNSKWIFNNNYYHWIFRFKFNNIEIGWFTWSDGTIFTGTFYHNNIEERGTYEWNDGRRYEGDWKDNLMNVSILVFNLRFNHSNYDSKIHFQ